MIDKNDDSTAVLEGQRIGRGWPVLLLLVAGLLAACGEAVAPPTAAPVAVAVSPTQVAVTSVVNTPSITASPSPLLRTPAGNSATATRPAATATAIPTPTTTASVTATATISLSPVPTVPFQVAGQVAGEIGALWPAAGGAVWVLATDGLYAATSGGITRLSERVPVAVLGEDGTGRTWVLFDGGATVAAYAAGRWTFYGPEAGWEAAPAAVFGRGEAGVVDRQGRVWLALGRAGLRRLDPAAGSWQTLRGADIGYGPPPAGEAGFFAYDERLAFTAVAVDNFGNVWVSACAVRVTEEGPFPLLLGEGQGVRWFDGEGWAGPAESGGRCVQDIEVDGSGRVWLAGRENDLWEGNVFVRYEPDPGQWVEEPVPESEADFAENPRFAGDFWFDGGGRPWMRVERRGGATFPPDAVYYEEGDAWVPFLSLLPGRMAGRTDGILWLFLEVSGGTPAGELAPGLYRYEAGRFAPVAFAGEVIDPATMVVDAAGRAWFAGRDGRSVWYYEGGGPS